MYKYIVNETKTKFINETHYQDMLLTTKAKNKMNVMHKIKHNKD